MYEKDLGVEEDNAEAYRLCLEAANKTSTGRADGVDEQEKQEPRPTSEFLV